METMVIESRVEEIESVCDRFEAFGEAQGLPMPVVTKVCVCFDEMISNIIKYGYGDGVLREIEVSWEIEDGMVVAVISDEAEAFNPLDAELPDVSLPDDQRPVGGLGIFLVRKFMSSIHYESLDGKNVFTMKIRI